MTNEKKNYSSDYKDYKFEEKAVGTFNMNVTESDIEGIIVGAFEGGSNYWLGLNNSTEIWKDRPEGVPFSIWATQMLIEGKTLDFYDIEDEDETWTLTLEQLVKGFGMNYKLRPWDSSLENGDASTADCILQYGIFGKIVYG